MQDKARKKRKVGALRCPECTRTFPFKNSLEKKKAIRDMKVHLVEWHGYRICRVCHWPFRPAGYEKVCPKHKDGLRVGPRFQKLMRWRIKAGEKFQIS